MEIFTTPFGLLDLYGHRLKLILVTIYLFPICLIPLKKSSEIQEKSFKVIITARDYTNRFLRVEKQHVIAQKQSSKNFSQH